MPPAVKASNTLPLCKLTQRFIAAVTGSFYDSATSGPAVFFSTPYK